MRIHVSTPEQTCLGLCRFHNGLRLQYEGDLPIIDECDSHYIIGALVRDSLRHRIRPIDDRSESFGSNAGLLTGKDEVVDSSGGEGGSHLSSS